MLPQWLARVSDRFRTPWVSLLVNTSIALVLLWTRKFGFVLNIALLAMFLYYGLHSASLIVLPFVRPEIYKTARVRLRPILLVIFGSISVVAMAYLSFVTIASDVSKQRALPMDEKGMPLWVLLLLWMAVGTMLYAVARWEGRRSGFDYKRQLSEGYTE
jgi:amino acid transporter